MLPFFFVFAFKWAVFQFFLAVQWPVLHNPAKIQLQLLCSTLHATNLDLNHRLLTTSSNTSKLVMAYIDWCGRLALFSCLVTFFLTWSHPKSKIDGLATKMPNKYYKMFSFLIVTKCEKMRSEICMAYLSIFPDLKIRGITKSENFPMYCKVGERFLQCLRIELLKSKDFEVGQLVRSEEIELMAPNWFFLWSGEDPGIRKFLRLQKFCGRIFWTSE